MVIIKCSLLILTPCTFLTTRRLTYACLYKILFSESGYFFFVTENILFVRKTDCQIISAQCDFAWDTENHPGCTGTLVTTDELRSNLLQPDLTLAI